jgi:hypothetical protein
MTHSKRHQHQQHQPPHPSQETPWWKRRPQVWLWPVISAAVIATSTAFGTGIGQDLFNNVFADNGPDGPPVTIESAQYQEVFGFGNSFAFPRQLTPAQASSFNSGQEDYPNYMTRIAAIGGVQIRDAAVEIVLRGNAKQTVTIPSIEIVSHCAAPVSGTLLYSPSAGSPPSILIGFNLDSEFPIAQNANYGQLSGSYFANHTISLQPGEIETLVLHALTTRQYCTFTYKLIVDTADGQVTESVDNRGKPFAVTALLTEKLSNGNTSYGKYRTMYAGGVGSPNPNGTFERVNPNTY